MFKVGYRWTYLNSAPTRTAGAACGVSGAYLRAFDFAFGNGGVNLILFKWRADGLVHVSSVLEKFGGHGLIS